MRIITMHEYARLERPRVEWVVRDLIPDGALILLVGEAKAGKSYLALQLALAVSDGTPFLHHSTPRPRRVLYINLDASEASWRARIQELEALEGLSFTGPLIIHPEHDIRPCDIMLPSVQRQIAAAMQEANPDVVIIDVLRELHTSDEQNSREMKRVFDALYALIGTRTLVILHHITKVSNKEFPRIIDLCRGSSYLVGKADAVWVLLDGSLHLIPRFAPRQILAGQQRPSGLWDFPR